MLVDDIIRYHKLHSGSLLPTVAQKCTRFGPQLNPDSDSPTWVWFWFWFSDLLLILQLDFDLILILRLDFDFDSLTWFWFSNLILIFVSLIQFLLRFSIL